MVIPGGFIMLKNLLNKIFSTASSTKLEVPQQILAPHKIYLFEANQYEIERILESPDLPGKAPGYVYFVQEYMNGSFKIGKTKNIEKRMNVFGVKLPFENKLIYLIKTGNHHQTEVSFHKHFSDKRLDGEWFALNKDDVAWVKAGIYTPEINETIQASELTVQPKENLKNKEDNLLTDKQIEFTKTLLLKLEQEYELITDYSKRFKPFKWVF